MKTGFTHGKGEFSVSAQPTTVCSITLEEKSGFVRLYEPVKFGFPFPEGMILDTTQLVLIDPKGTPQLLQIQVLSRWEDGSVQWALIDFMATIGPYQKSEYSLLSGQEVREGAQSDFSMIIQKGDLWIVNTGKVRFEINATTFKPFEQVMRDGFPFLVKGKSMAVLTDEAGEVWEPHISNMEVEASGPVRVTLRIEGALALGFKEGLDFIGRLSFFRKSGLVEMAFTLRNSRAAHHPGGLWDLGDAGSIIFKDLSFHLSLITSDSVRTRWKSQPISPLQHHQGTNIQVYQDSSGGENWRSTNHVNRYGKVMNTFRGYRVLSSGSVIEEGNRATPVIYWDNGHQSVSATIKRFWENFPKGLECSRDRICLGVFPHQYNDVFELQGGEQKTHTMYLCFDGGDEGQAGLDWVHDRLVAHSEPTWYARSKAISYLNSRGQDENRQYLETIDSAIIGENTFFHRREIIDEYGWRNFGELYADHESIGQQEHSPRISHYNNQYDAIHGMLVEFFRTGDLRWYQLVEDLANHVIDIDIYHTKKDRPYYDGGLFWHTDHYLDAETANHRSFSRINRDRIGSRAYGGGPSNEHNYTSGLLMYYFMTGDSLAYEVVQSLADWVINMDQGRSGILGILDRRPGGFASMTVQHDYHGPGRGGGNSINALIDGYRLTKNKRYLFKAEELIRRCIHPNDCIEERNLWDIEGRWSYLVFLQVLGKYLDCKCQWNSFDYMYEYAKASLLHYARWMAKNEVPYKQVLDRVEIPTETWPAQDIRKSNIFDFAGKYSECDERVLFFQKADFFFMRSVSDLLSFKTWHFTRPLVIMLGNGYMHAYFQMNPDESAPRTIANYQFGRPSSFTPQLYEAYKGKARVTTAIGRVKQLISSIGTRGNNKKHA